MKVTFKKYTSAVIVSLFICVLFVNCVQASTLSYNTLYSSFQSALKAGDNDKVIEYAEKLAVVLESRKISSTSYKAFMLGKDTEQVSIEEALKFYEIALKYAPCLFPT